MILDACCLLLTLHPSALFRSVHAADDWMLAITLQAGTNLELCQDSLTRCVSIPSSSALDARALLHWLTAAPLVAGSPSARLLKAA